MLCTRNVEEFFLNNDDRHKYVKMLEPEEINTKCCHVHSITICFAQLLLFYCL